ncbi:MAG: hypothetical protein WBK88_04500 [Methanothrix sp.]
MTEKIAVLLARLEELDQETWSEWRYVYRGNWEGAEYEPGVKLERTDLWLLQGVVQEAIVALPDPFVGFGLTYTSYFDANKYDAEIYSELAYEDLKGHGDTPAAALLRAYIAAREAQQGAGE